MKKLRKIDGACAVVALHHVSGIDEETVLRVCTLHGFKPHEGMEDDDWKEAADDLGLKLRSVGKMNMRLGSFMKKYQEGLYLVGTHGHLFVVDNGLLVDPRMKESATYPGLGRLVKEAWRVSVN